MFNLHNKVLEVAGLYNKKANDIVVDSTEKAFIEEQEIIEIWKQYVIEFFEDERPNIQGNVNQEEGPQFKNNLM